MRIKKNYKMENDKISKIEDKEYPDFDLKNCDKENIVIKTKSENINIRSDNKKLKLQ